MIEILKGTPLPQDWMAFGGILSATAAVGAAFYFLVYLGQLDDLASIQAEDQTVIANLEKARQIEREIDKLKAETDEIELLVSTFERRLPSERELVQMQFDIEDMAIQEEIRMTVSPRLAITDANKETIPYNVVATGTYHKVAGFINRLERYARYLKVSELNLTGKDAVTSAEFMLYTYTFIEENAGGS